MSIKLSICIPTYNRGAFIGETLESIVSQATNDEVEIVVSDNASVDNTEEIVRKFQQRYSRVIYYKWNKNMGADRNFLKVIELANGEYCWLMGSDDIIEQGGIKTVIRYLKYNFDLCGISVNHFAYDIKLSQRLLPHPVIQSFLTKDKLYLDGKEAFADLAVYFGYMSAHILHRNTWLYVTKNYNLEPFFNSYIHVYIMGKMLQIKPRWLYIHKRCVGWRSGNDSFLQMHGSLKRLELDVHGYIDAAEDILGESLYKKKIVNKVVSTPIFNHIITAKFNDLSLDFYIKAFFICIKKFYNIPIFWVKVLPIFFIPSPLLKLSRYLYRKTLKKIKIYKSIKAEITN